MSWHIDPTVKAAVGYAGAAAAIALFLSPVRTFWQIRKTRSIEDFSGVPYAVTLCNCVTWTLYSLPFVTASRYAVLVCNGVGAVLEAIYVSIYLRYSRGQQRRNFAFKLLGPALVYTVTLSVLVLSSAIPRGDTDTTVLGVLGAIWATSMFASPLAAMRLVITTKSTEYMPFLLSLCTFLCAACFGTYGIYVRDVYVMVPNVLGSILGIIQLVLYAMYYKRPVRASADELSTPESQASESKPDSVAGLCPPAGSHLESKAPTVVSIVVDAPTKQDETHSKLP
eukprot:jgi/Chlat1/5051/Chrsp33S05057